MSNGLHIKVLQNKNDFTRFDSSLGSLVLPQSGSFVVAVKEYAERKKQIDDKHKRDDEIARNKWNERAKAGWSKEKLEINWNANQKERNATQIASQTNLEKDYKDANWVWTVAPQKIESKNQSHNDSFNKGIIGSGEYSINFPKILEGGGLAYLEAFLPKDGAKGAKPFGIFVQATGKPRIIRVEWTDFDYNPLEGKVVAFNSEVLLHIYTEALYGQELEIKLFDEDIFVDDDLKIAKGAAFLREVNIQKVHPKEIGKKGVADTLVKADQDKTDNKIEKEHFIQKITIEVKVDYTWMKAAGEHLKIYPTVKSLQTSANFENFSRAFLEVCSIDGTLYDTPLEITNVPVVKGEINTNVAQYHPCKYTAIDYLNNKNEIINIYTEQDGVSTFPIHEIGIIAGEKTEPFFFNTGTDTNTNECIYHGKSNDHAISIFSYDQKNKPKEINVFNHATKSIEGNVIFDYDRLDMLKYFWLSNDFKKVQKYRHFKIFASSCRHQETLNITVLPDIEWELAFIITTTAGFRVKGENTTFTRLEQGLGKFQFRGIKAEQTGKVVEKGGVGYSLNIKYSINGGAFYEQISLDFVRSIEKIIGTYNAIVGFAEIFKGDEENVTSAAISKSVINKITFDIEPPSIVFLLKWKYDYAKRNRYPVVNFTGAAGFRPLIGLKIGFDITQNLGMFGMAGQAVQWLLDIIEKLIKEDIYILAEAGSAFNYDIGLSYNEIDGFAPGTKQRAILDITFSFKAGIKRKETILITDVKKMTGNTIPVYQGEQETLKIEGSITTGIRYTEEHGFEKGKGKYKKTETKWLGAEMTITVVTLAHNRKQNRPPNDQFKDKFILLKPRDIDPAETTYENSK